MARKVSIIARSKPRHIRPGKNISRRYKKSMLGKWGNHTIYRYKQSLDGSTIATGFTGKILTQTGAAQTGGIVATLADVPQQAILTALYDEYRIVRVVIKMVPMVKGMMAIDSQYGTTAGSGVLGAANNWGLLYTIVDHDGAPPTTTAGFNQYQTVKKYRVLDGKTIVLNFKPSILIGSQIAGGTITANQTRVSPWLDCQNNNVNHYLGAWYLEPYGVQGATSAQIYQIEATYYLEFRNVR